MNIYTPTWFIEGFWQPLQDPSQLILLVSLGLLSGQQGQHVITKNLALFAGSLGIGFILNHFYTPIWNVERSLLISALSMSLLVTVQLQLPRVLLFLFNISSGIMLGWASTPISIPGFGNSIMYNWSSGVLISMTLLLAVVSYLSFLLRNLIHGIALRVIASWIATSALFVLTLLFIKS